MTEVAALKKALAEAKDKAAKERAAREKHEARVGEVQQELQDENKKYESLERDSKTQGSKLVKARQSARDARAEAQSALQEIQAAKKIAAGKAFTMQGKYAKETVLCTYPNLCFSRSVYRSAVQRAGCCRVLSGRRRDDYREAVLVPISWTRTSGAL